MEIVFVSLIASLAWIAALILALVLCRSAACADADLQRFHAALN
jgi:hypothetical protein